MYYSNYLTETWTVSRGRDTYGYNICTIKDAYSGIKGQCNGGGYDMAGTSLITIDNAGCVINDRTDKRVYFGGGDCRKQGRFYGTSLTITKKGLNTVSVDGSCGLGNVVEIYAKAGVSIAPSYDNGKRRRTRTGWFVSFEG